MVRSNYFKRALCVCVFSHITAKEKKSYIFGGLITIIILNDDGKQD